jgi:hypothetical protein
MDDNHVDSHHVWTPICTLEEIIAELSDFTVELCSLAWSPEPPFESVGTCDCRVGGDCGLDTNRETARARWRRARHRWNREQRKRGRQDPHPCDI